MIRRFLSLQRCRPLQQRQYSRIASVTSGALSSAATAPSTDNFSHGQLYNSQTARLFSTQLTKALDELIAERAREPQTSVSLQALMRTGRGEYLHRTFGEETRERHAATDLVLIQVASFLRHELPIRLAHRIQDLQSMRVLSEMNSIKAVMELYKTSLQELEDCPPRIETTQQEQIFAQVVQNIYERHSKVLVQMARGAFEFRTVMREQKQSDELQQDTNAFLDRFYLCRIGKYLALRQPFVPNYIGIICSETSPYEIVKRAIDDAAFMCTRKYGEAPDVIMSGRLDLTFPYVPTHLHYIMLELLKNSMRATVEWHGVDCEEFPPIKVVIADGDENEDVVIKVSDEGGGISRSNMKKIWSYLFTTADPGIQEGMVGGGSGDNVDHGIDAPLAGLGYGLPISRSYCRYFGGDISVMSMEGYGTDAFVYLARLGNMKEPLPI
jgi:pyruvate dehydrogenase kinase 2/3/4